MNDLIKFNNKSLANLTMAEIQQTADKIEITKEKIKLQKKVDNTLLTIQIDSYEEGTFTTFGKVVLPDKKSDYTDTVLSMLSNGEKQKDIAFKLGISQSLVSKIKNQNR